MKITLLIVGILFFLSCSQDRTIRFALFSDTHVSENTTGAEDLRMAVKDVNELENLDFVLISGDITEMNIGNNLQIAKRILDSLTVPYYIIPGNHDTKWSGSAGANFRSLWSDDKFVFDAGKYRFIGFHQGPVLRMDDGHIPRADLDWLQDNLRAAGRDKPVILVMHYPLTPAVDNWFECIDIIREFNIQAIIHGHGHRSSLSYYNGIPGIMGRSTLRASNEYGGFSLLELRHDSIFVSEMATGSGEKRKWLGLDLTAGTGIQPVADSLLPDYSVNQKYPQIKLKWLFDGGFTTTASPVTDDSQVYIGDVSGHLHVLDLRTGLERWSYLAGGAIYSAAAVDSNYLVFNAADSIVHCLKRDKQSLLWQYRTNNALLAVPVIFKGVVYTGASDGIFRAINLADGKLIWQFQKVMGFVETRPLIFRDKVIFGAWDGHLYALNLNDGSLAWTWHGEISSPLYSPAACWPVGAYGKVFIAAPDRFLSAVDVQTGKTIWRNNDWKFRETVGISNVGDVAYARSMTDSVIAISTHSRNFNLVWHENFKYGYDIAPSMPMEKDGTLFWGTKNGLITAANAKDGKLIWQYRFENYLINTVEPISSGQVVFSNIDGKTGLIGL
ncbi:MAG: PQQ-binding-like beta-propeller repeat protein [bacterium]|nr:MAG: PQQ-binding-like beta-propeller repeat protein [bacterium]